MKLGAYIYTRTDTMILMLKNIGKARMYLVDSDFDFKICLLLCKKHEFVLVPISNYTNTGIQTAKF